VHGEVAHELDEVRVAALVEAVDELPDRRAVSRHRLRRRLVGGDVDGERRELERQLGLAAAEDLLDDQPRRLRLPDGRARRGLGREVVEQPEHEGQLIAPLGRAEERRQLWQQPGVGGDDGGAQLLVEGEVEEETQRGGEERLLLVRHEGGERAQQRGLRALLGLWRPLAQLRQVLLEDGELHQEEQREHEQLRVLLAAEHRREEADDAALRHLALDVGFLGQVEQHVEAHVQQLLLLAYLEALALLLHRVGGRALALGLGLLELAHAGAFRLALDHLEHVRAHACLREQLVKLRKVGEGVEDVENVDGEVHRLGTLLLQQAREQPEQGLVLEQRLQVLRLARQLQDVVRRLRGGLRLLVHRLHVLVELVEAGSLVLAATTALALALLLALAPPPPGRRGTAVLAALLGHELLQQLLDLRELRRMDELALLDDLLCQAWDIGVLGERL